MTTTSLHDAPPLMWACDANNNELDPGLKEAHYEALKDIPCQKLSEAEAAEPILLRNLLDADQIDEILKEASAEAVWPRGVCNKEEKCLPPPCRRHRLAKCCIGDSVRKSDGDLASDELRSVPHHLAWTGGHTVLYMHMNDWFVRSLPDQWSVIRGGMESRPWMEGAIPVLDDEFIGSYESMKDVRTIELHHYGTGGGLLTPGHRDYGSDLTISILLSEPAEVSGGDFVTYRKGVPVAHKIGRGDAILFNSEKLHNISTITGGIRQSLVVELWPSKRY